MQENDTRYSRVVRVFLEQRDGTLTNDEVFKTLKDRGTPYSRQSIGKLLMDHEVSKGPRKGKDYSFLKLKRGLWKIVPSNASEMITLEISATRSQLLGLLKRVEQLGDEPDEVDITLKMKVS